MGKYIMFDLEDKRLKSLSSVLTSKASKGILEALSEDILNKRLFVPEVLNINPKPLLKNPVSATSTVNFLLL